jgi:hypothetical protein
MSQPRFLTNHDFNEHIILGVHRREPGVEFLRARDAGLAQTPDADLLAWAATERWLVLSHDVNTLSAAAFARLAAGQPLRGVFLVHQRSPVATIIDEVLLVWASSELEEWDDQVRFLPL